MTHVRRLLVLALLAAAVWAGEATRLACIGDSITAGSGADKDHSYPVLLQKLLGDGWQVRNFGVSGSTMSGKGNKPYIAEGQWKQAREWKPQVVLIMLGTNDSKKGNMKQAAGFKDDLVAMVKELQALDSKPRVVLCLPCFVVDPGAFDIDQKRLEQGVLPAITAAAKELGLPLIDVQAATKAAFTKDPSLIPDRVHPNGAGYAILAETIKAGLDEALSPKAKAKDKAKAK